MKTLLVILSVLVFLMCSGFSVCVAQEVEETEFAWGIVASISSDKITVKEYDFDSDQETEVTYNIGADVELDNIKSLSDIEIGDSVDIEFMRESENKVATSISVEKAIDIEENINLEEDLEDTEETF